jgi:phenylpropionate dioxygenase-like ring-hydroxylating dioxygenase large terminal subunit
VQDIRRTNIHPDHWYPLAWSEDVKAGAVIGRAFAGDPIALVRTEAGSVFAVEDRCAHRQVPLSKGVVKGELLQCGYHCWTYDAGGRCVNVPYLDGPKSLPNGVRHYPCRESSGLVFIFAGDPAKAGSIPVPDVPRYGDPNYKHRRLKRPVDCHYSFMHENLMDMNHQFLHRRLMGGISAKVLSFDEGESWAEVDYTISRTGGSQPLGEKFMIGERRQGGSGREHDLMTIRTDYPYQSLKFTRAGWDEPALDLWNAYVPVDREQRSNLTFCNIAIRRPATPGLINLLWPFITWFTDGIFAEDKRIVELEQRAFDRQGADRNQEIFPVIKSLRRVLLTQGIPQASLPPATDFQDRRATSF